MIWRAPGPWPIPRRAAYSNGNEGEGWRAFRLILLPHQPVPGAIVDGAVHLTRLGTLKLAYGSLGPGAENAIHSDRIPAGVELALCGAHVQAIVALFGSDDQAVPGAQTHDAVGRYLFRPLKSCDSLLRLVAEDAVHADGNVVVQQQVLNGANLFAAVAVLNYVPLERSRKFPRPVARTECLGQQGRPRWQGPAGQLPGPVRMRMQARLL